MTAAQSLNLYNISLRYFKSEADAAQFVKEIEVVVDNKFEAAKDTLSTKEDIYALKEDIHSTAQKLYNKMGDQFKWIIGLFIPLYLSILGLFVAILLKK